MIITVIFYENMQILFPNIIFQNVEPDLFESLIINVTVKISNHNFDYMKKKKNQKLKMKKK